MRTLVFILSLVCLCSCTERGEVQTSIPMMPVSLQIYLQSAEAKPLRSPGGILIVTEPRTAGEQLGFGGIAVVRSITEQGGYYAFDLACPQEVSREVRLELREVELVCPRCQSHFDILGGVGIPISGVARSPLRMYRASLLSSGVLQIRG